MVITVPRDHRLVHLATGVALCARTGAAFRCRFARREFPRVGEVHADIVKRPADIARSRPAATIHR